MIRKMIKAALANAQRTLDNAIRHGHYEGHIYVTLFSFQGHDIAYKIGLCSEKTKLKRPFAMCKLHDIDAVAYISESMPMTQAAMVEYAIHAHIITLHESSVIGNEQYRTDINVFDIVSQFVTLTEKRVK